MSFRSAEPPLKSQTALRLHWDCSQNEGAISQLVGSWIAAANGSTRGGSQSGPVLSKKEQQEVDEILQLETSEVISKLESLLRVDMVHFTQVRSQVLSLLIAWEQVILEKEQDQERLYIRRGEDEARLTPREFMILFQITYYRAQAGLTVLPISTSDAVGPTNIYLPTEIWHAITTWLDPLDKLSFLVTHKGASGAFTRRQLQHTRLWTTIFKNDSWISKVLSYGLQPVVIGCQLDNICGYMILAFAGDVSETPDTLRDPNCLLRSLRSQNFSLEDLEVAFEQFTLNVCHILELGDVIDMLDPRQLFTDSSGTAELSISYYRDTSSRIDSIHPLLATEEEVAVSHQSEKGRQNWLFRLRGIEPGLRRLHQCPLGISQEWFLSRMKDLSTNS